MADVVISKGLDLPMAGIPDEAIEEALPSRTAAVYPAEIPGIKPKLSVREGDTVRRGDPLYTCKKTRDVRFCAPAAGRVEEIRIGHRRAVEKIVIARGDPEDAVSFEPWAADRIRGMDREELLDRLLETGFIGRIRRRPFSRMADPDDRPKSVFVNAMTSAPFDAVFHVVLKGRERAFQAGLTAMSRLTEGRVHLCVPAAHRAVYTGYDDVELHTFAGPHPAGRTSVHMHYIDPLRPGDAVWTAMAADVLDIGRLLTEGRFPDDRIVCAGGPGVREDHRKYYRVRPGAEIASVLKGRTAEGPHRVIGGNILAGRTMEPDGHLDDVFGSLTVIPEAGDRRFLGWLDPGFRFFSISPAFISRWLSRNEPFVFDTDANGSPRSMVATGLYDKYFPMDILVDFLVVAVLAHDTDEAVRLGLLETEPEDFAVCSYVCPSNMDLVSIMRRGLEEIEAEGLF